MPRCLMPAPLLSRIAICFAVLGAQAAVAQESKAKKPVDLLVTDADIVTKAAVCRWTSEPPVLDGRLDDPCWKRAAVIDKFASFWMDPPKSRPGTKAYLIWDDDALYYAGSMTDAELRSFGTKRNDHLWNGDVFELFLKPSAERPEYYEFQANPRGVIFEAPFPGAGMTSGARSPMLRSWAARPPYQSLEHSISRAIAMSAGVWRGAFPGPRSRPAASPKPAMSGCSRSAGMTTAKREPRPSP